MNKNFSIVKIDKNHFIGKENEKTINLFNGSCVNIIRSHEQASNYEDDDVQHFNDLATDFFLSDSRSFIYVMFKGKEPISFAIIGENTDVKRLYALEMVYTHEEYTNIGMAQVLLSNIYDDLSKNEDAETMVATVNNKNESSLHLNDTMGKDINQYVEDEGKCHYAKREDERTKFIYDISKYKCPDNEKIEIVGINNNEEELVA